MISLRLIRTGRKNQSSFRIVAQEKRRAPKGAYLELLGNLSPLTKQRSVKKERVLHWLSVGAKPTDTVWNILVSEKIVAGAKRPAHKKSKKEQKEIPSSLANDAGKGASNA